MNILEKIKSDTARKKAVSFDGLSDKDYYWRQYHRFLQDSYSLWLRALETLEEVGLLQYQRMAELLKEDKIDEFREYGWEIGIDVDHDTQMLEKLDKDAHVHLLFLAGHYLELYKLKSA